ncbi:protein inturned isoform X2 [Syngnathus typhle]|uniref:protein inturned isoform X2 n=1 Tax=Syngnathus typhle TaxID=161592 RepID=UPI002A6A61B4|nr:protein inturned isoform X2 [Syngnathus typhle]
MSSSNDPQPEWPDNVQKNGELFYLELSQEEEEAAADRSSRARISEGKRDSGDRGDTREGGMPSGSVSKTQLRTAWVYLNPKGVGDSGALPLLEALLGVVRRPGKRNGAAMGREERLTVDGLIPGGPASKCGHVLIGDVLVAVGNVEVNAENIEQVLAGIAEPSQVRLTLATPWSSSRAAAPSISPPTRPLLGDDGSETQMFAARIPHALMYLSLKMDTKSPQDEEEILYQYPASEAAARLKGARGIFLTLCDMLDSVTGAHVVSSTLLLDKHLVHVGYWKEGHALLVLGLPAERVPLLSLQSLVGDVVRTLQFTHGSLERAFGKTEGTVQLDHFFRLFFLRLLRPSDSPPAPPADDAENIFLDGLPAVRWLTLPVQVKTNVDSVLSDFEASDFGEMSEDSFGLRRLYGILGSCLFYKSYLIASHLPKEDLLDVCLYIRHYRLLSAERRRRRRTGQLLIWREVFLQGPLPRRHFLLIVGLGCWLQCVLLEARSCARHSDASPGPDCIYVDQAKATLLRLEILEEAVEDRLNAPAAPRLFCADWFLQAGPSQAHLDGPFGEKTQDWRGEGHTDTGAQWTKRSNPFYLSALMKTLSRRDADEMPGASRLSVGAENILFHYLLMETVQGIFIGPTLTDEAQLGGSVHPLLVRNFHRCCLSIRAVFKENMSLQGQRAAGRPGGVGPVKEHGVLFQFLPENRTEQRKAAPTLTYWVIGRLLLEPVPQEFYVCFHDSVPEVPVEMAFRLSFGLAT